MNFVTTDTAAHSGVGGSWKRESGSTPIEQVSAPPVFVINLRRDSERRRHMTQLLDKIGIRAEFVAAVDGHTLSAADRAAYDHRRSLRIYGVDMLDTEIGCFLSHYRLYERIVQ